MCTFVKCYRQDERGLFRSIPWWKRVAILDKFGGCGLSHENAPQLIRSLDLHRINGTSHWSNQSPQFQSSKDNALEPNLHPLPTYSSFQNLYTRVNPISRSFLLLTHLKSESCSPITLLPSRLIAAWRPHIPHHAQTPHTKLFRPL